MSRMQFLLANYTEEIWRRLRFFDPSTTQGLIVLGAIAVVLLLGLTWVLLIQRSRKARHSHRHHHHHHDRPQQFGKDPASANEEEEEEEDSDGEDDDEPHKKRRRRRRREHRPRNPTLAETGGLPPVRTEDPPGP
jgi:ABC-type nickel/cobalt efflux system permease component RcnA